MFVAFANIEEPNALTEIEARQLHAELLMRTPTSLILLNEHDAPRRPPTRADEHNTFDVIAKRVVAAGGGTQAVIDANAGSSPTRR